MADLPRISDVDGKLYLAFGLRRATMGKLLSPTNWGRGLVVMLRHGFSLPKGDMSLMPGVFLLHQGRVVREFRHRSPADRPDYLRLAALE